MSMKIKDPKDPNKEIEVFTAEELAAEATKKATEAATAAAAKAIEDYKASNPDKTAEIEGLKNKIAELSATIAAAEGFDDGSPERKAQIARLKSEREAREKEMMGKIDTLTKTVTDLQAGNLATAKKAALDKYAGTDPEARKKVELEFDKYDPTNVTPEGIDARMKAAAGIAGVANVEQPGAMDGMGGHGGARGDGNRVVSTKPTDNTLQIAKQLGIKPEEVEAHLAKKAEDAGNKK